MRGIQIATARSLGVRGFIFLSDALFANKNANPWHGASLRQNRLLQNVFSARDADLAIIDLDAVERLEPRL